MRRLVLTFMLIGVSSVSLGGCQSHQSKVDALQKEYDDLEGQFRKDCSEAYLQAQPKLSPKCEEEDKKAKGAWALLQAERNRK